MERVKLEQHEWLTLIEAKARTLADNSRGLSGPHLIEKDLERLIALVGAWKAERDAAQRKLHDSWAGLQNDVQSAMPPISGWMA